MVPGEGFEPSCPYGREILSLQRLANFATPARFLFVKTSIVRGQTMAIRTEYPQVLKTIILPVSIDMVKLKRNPTIR